MKKIIPIIALFMATTAFAQNNATETAKLRIAPVLGMQVFQNMPDMNGSGFKLFGPIGFSAGLQGKYAFAEKFAVGFLAQGVYSITEHHRLIDIELEPQIEYKPFHYASIYVSLNNRINTSESLKLGDDWIESSRVKIGNEYKDLRMYAPYELRGKIGLRGYGKKENAFIDLSYIYGITNAWSYIDVTDENGLISSKLFANSSGFRLSVGYFFGIKPKKA
jgi:hypothetical protein